MTKTGEGRGNDGLWKERKTKNGFPSLPTALGNRCAIPTFPPPQRRTQMEKWKSKSRIPTFPLHGFPLPNSFRKEAELRIASLPPSGSSFDEKMLSSAQHVDDCRSANSICAFVGRKSACDFESISVEGHAATLSPGIAHAPRRNRLLFTYRILLGW